MNIFPTKAAVAGALAAEIAQRIAQAGATDFHLALAGGSTPAALYDALALSTTNWARVHLWWSDERCVPPDNSQSNYGMVKKHLLDKIGIPSANIHRMRGELEASEACRACVHELERAFPLVVPKFDLILLGLGEDGHTASIFPQNIALFDSEEFCVVAEHPESGQKRLSFTGKIINSARTVVFLIAGESKASRLLEVLRAEGADAHLPAARVQPAEGELLFFLDQEAASGL